MFSKLENINKNQVVCVIFLVMFLVFIFVTIILQSFENKIVKNFF